MNKVFELTDKAEIEEYLRKDVYLNLYGLGDLDDYYWKYTRCFAVKRKSEIRTLFLLYQGLDIPILLALPEDHIEDSVRLFKSLIVKIPPHLFTNLCLPLIDIASEFYTLTSDGRHHKMGLLNFKKQDNSIAANDDVIKLSLSNLNEIMEFYRNSYPGNWFYPKMLESNHYYGIRHDNKLVSIAGLHVFSKKYKVAVLGNIATLPDYRHRGLATQVLTRLLTSLANDVDHIGLNVRTDNFSAINCYKKLGFEITHTYEEFMMELKRE